MLDDENSCLAATWNYPLFSFVERRKSLVFLQGTELIKKATRNGSKLIHIKESLHFSVTHTRNFSHKMVITTRTGCYDIGICNNQALATQSVRETDCTLNHFVNVIVLKTFNCESAMKLFFVCATALSGERWFCNLNKSTPVPHLSC